MLILNPNRKLNMGSPKMSQNSTFSDFEDQAQAHSDFKGL